MIHGNNSTTVYEMTRLRVTVTQKLQVRGVDKYKMQLLQLLRLCCSDIMFGTLEGRWARLVQDR